MCPRTASKECITCESAAPIGHGELKDAASYLVFSVSQGTRYAIPIIMSAMCMSAARQEGVVQSRTRSGKIQITSLFDEEEDYWRRTMLALRR